VAKYGLGKGMDALLPPDRAAGDKAPDSPAQASLERLIPLEKLRSNPHQPRKNFNDGELQELAASIREHGVIQPIIAEEGEDGNYIIVAGERRSRAAKLAGLKTVPVILRKYSEEKRMEVALIENIQRADLNPIEEASAYKKLMAFTGLSQEEVALRVGKHRATVANALRLLKLPGEIRESLQQGGLTAGHARAILSVNRAGGQERLYQDILKGDLSVREAERRAALINGEPKKGAGGEEEEEKASRKRAPELGAMEEKFIGRLGTKVCINGDLNRGSITIDYYSMEDLERLYEILGG
jgi:ParB family chromosome partitioning protein